MKPIVAAIVLLTVSGATCSDKRLASAQTDPAVLAECPRGVESPGGLPAREIVTLPAGTVLTLPDGSQRTLPRESQFVPLADANARENMLVRGALVFRDAYGKCRSVVIYVEDRDRALAQ